MMFIGAFLQDILSTSVDQETRVGQLVQYMFYCHDL